MALSPLLVSLLAWVFHAAVFRLNPEWTLLSAPCKRSCVCALMRDGIRRGCMPLLL